MGFWSRMVGVLSVAVFLAACQSSQRTPATFINSGNSPAGATGDGFGPQDGSTAPGIVGGAVLGGIASSDVGRSLDETDRQRASQAEFYALEAGQAGTEQRWNNPQTNTSGLVVAGEPYQINRSQCRDYTHTVSVSGGDRTVRGTACRQPNGTWRAVGG